MSTDEDGREPDPHRHPSPSPGRAGAPGSPGGAPPAAESENGERSLRVVIAASMLSKIADWQLGIVVPLAVLAETDSIAVALVAFALRWLPYIASPLVGSLIDRYDKRAVFMWAQFTQAICLALVALLLTERVAVGVFLFLSGFGAVAVTITGQFVLIPKLIVPERQAVAVAKLASAIELSKVGGLLLGGLLISARGPRFAAWTVTVLYVVAGLIVVLLPRIPTAGVRKKIRHDLGIGFRWVVQPDILRLVVTMTLANLAVGELETVLVTVFGERDISAVLISLLVAAGLLVGALGSRVSPHVMPSWSLESRVLLFQVMSFVSLCVIALPHVVWTAVGYACVSFALGGSNVASITYRQATIPVELAGRVNAVIRMFITGAIPLSAFLYAWATRFEGVWFWVPALVIAAVSVVTWAVDMLRAARSPGRARRAQPAEQ